MNRPTIYAGEFILTDPAGEILWQVSDPELPLKPGEAVYLWQHKRYILYRSAQSPMEGTSCNAQ